MEQCNTILYKNKGDLQFRIEEIGDDRYLVTIIRGSTVVGESKDRTMDDVLDIIKSC